MNSILFLCAMFTCFRTDGPIWRAWDGRTVPKPPYVITIVPSRKELPLAKKSPIEFIETRIEWGKYGK